MGKKQAGLGMVLKAIAEGPLRSPLFHWLYKNHDEIARASAGRAISWVELCEKFKALGLTGCKGRPLTEENARKTWQQVHKEVRKQRAFRATGIVPATALRKKKLPADWCPSGFAQSNAPFPKGDEHQGSPPAALPAVPHQWPATPTTTPETPKETRRPGSNLDRVRELMNARSGRKPNGEPFF